ncbi:isoprenoid synthase domain-containing protein, partial [Collybia nuda]
FIIYIDDTSPGDVNPFVVFGPRFFSQTQQLDPVLDAFVDILQRICDQYEPATANYILASAFNYISSTCIEPEIEAHAVVPGVIRFPWFIRGQTGISLAFALMLFPKSKGVSAVQYIQVLDEMNFWISGVNDLMSFPKEQLAGERNNYVHVRARTEGKSPMEVLAELNQELHMSRKLICAALSLIPGASTVWSAFENGYIKWHLIQERYKLAEMDL